jgi:hypothetical protein
MNMPASQIDAAFGILFEEFERAISETNQKGAEAFVRKDYTMVSALAGEASRLAQYQTKVAALEAQWSGEVITAPAAPAVQTQNHEDKGSPATPPADFHDSCLKSMERKLGTNLTRHTRSSYANDTSSKGVVALVSRRHRSPEAPFFWFSVHPYHMEFLAKYREGHLVLGCGSPETVFAIPYAEFAPLCEKLNISVRDDGTHYYHIHIIGETGQHYLLLKGRRERVSIGKYLLS